MPKKKLLHIVEAFAGGVLYYFKDLTRNQVEDYDITILWGKRPLTPDNVEQLFDPRIKMICIEDFDGPYKTVFNLKNYYTVRKYYNEIKPDIVHLHSSAAGFVCRWALPCGKVPTFYTPHGFSFLPGSGSKLKRSFYHAVEWISAKRPAKIIACSKGEYEEALRLTDNCTYVSNGVPYDSLAPYRRSEVNLSEPIIVCTVGRIMTQKNPALFNRIAELLPNIKFIWIGDGELRPLLTSPNIDIMGWVNREQSLELTQKADFFILPSLWEGLPISLLESMALGKVCFVSDIIGNRDVIRDRENGRICTTAEQFADAIREAIASPSDCQRMIDCAMKDIREQYNASCMADKYSKIYRGEI